MGRLPDRPAALRGAYFQQVRRGCKCLARLLNPAPTGGTSPRLRREPPHRSGRGSVARRRFRLGRSGTRGRRPSVSGACRISRNKVFSRHRVAAPPTAVLIGGAAIPVPAGSRWAGRASLFAPTLIDGVRRDMAGRREEIIFGPVVLVAHLETAPRRSRSPNAHPTLSASRPGSSYRADIDTVDGVRARRGGGDGVANTFHGLRAGSCPSAGYWQSAFERELGRNAALDTPRRRLSTSAPGRAPAHTAVVGRIRRGGG